MHVSAESLDARQPCHISFLLLYTSLLLLHQGVQQSPQCLAVSALLQGLADLPRGNPAVAYD